MAVKIAGLRVPEFALWVLYLVFLAMLAPWLLALAAEYSEWVWRVVAEKL